MRGREVSLSGFCKVDVVRSGGSGPSSHERQSQACVRTVVPSQAIIWAKLFLRIYCFTANPGMLREQNLIVKHETFWPGRVRRKQRKVKH